MGWLAIVLRMSTIDPTIGTEPPEKNAASAPFGRVRRAILALLFTHSDESFYVRQIARATGGGLGAVHRELSNLVEAGLVVRARHGRQVYYQANRDSPVFADLRGLIARTAGVADVLRGALAPLADRIAAAFVYGSVARGSEKSDSDICDEISTRIRSRRQRNIASSTCRTAGGRPRCRRSARVGAGGSVSALEEVGG